MIYLNTNSKTIMTIYNDPKHYIGTKNINLGNEPSARGVQHIIKL